MRGASIFAAIGLIAFSFTVGCASSTQGTKLDASKVSSIQRGVSTRAQIEEMFGAPMNISLMGDGRRQMMYSFTESNHHVKGTTFIPIAGAFMGGSEGTVHHQQLQVILTKADVVEDYVMNDGTSNIDHSRNGFGGSSTSSTPVATPAAAR
jgi:outer membrane protein assembly factor BamE (lipoprotein component of BamABCDE complex)